MARSDQEQVTVTIPAKYLNDVRSALVAEVLDDRDALRTDHRALVDSSDDFHRSDRDLAVVILSRDLQLLEQVLHATGDTDVTAARGTIGETMQATVRELRDRLTEVCQYGPVPMGDVLDIGDRLRWATTEAVRLCPELDYRLKCEAVA